MELYQVIINQVANALDEDVGSGDISAQLIDAERHLNTELLVREVTEALAERFTIGKLF